MAEIASSIIVGETDSQVFSDITTTTKKDEDSQIKKQRERLEMARFKMEDALEISGKWQITDVSLLHWRKKLKRATRDCDDAARRCRQLSHEEDERKQLVRQFSFPRRIAHATKAFVSSLVGGNNNGDHCSATSSVAAAVRRFERFANSADEFMRFVQLGGTPRRPHLFFDPIIGHIFAGESLLYQVSHMDGRYNFCIWPADSEERGMVAMLSFVYEDRKVPMNNFRLDFMLRLSESTNIIGTLVKCLRLVTPHFKSTTDVVIKKITQLPTQDFSYVRPALANAHMDHWNPGLLDHVYNTLTRWFRPDPLCCQGNEHQGNVPFYGGSDIVASSSDSGNKFRLSSIFPEAVYNLLLQRHISPFEYNNLVPASSTTTSTGCDDMCASLENFPPLKLGILFLPHDYLEESKYVGEAGYAIEVIDGEKQQHHTHVNVHPNQLDEMFLPKAIDYLYHNVEATTYQICWRSNHGSAHLCMEKTKMFRVGRPTQGRSNNKVFRRMQQNEQMRKSRWKQLSLNVPADGGEDAASTSIRTTVDTLMPPLRPADESAALMFFMVGNHT
ncbi:hypothetical protein BRADI_2g60539v3 [Brachypodium distachyon]|uniref:Uncharacterized protein n=1 Tax=Brachypodium distachyon TaxID=15368 RepID=A0A0Q3RE64_BRADI|nr:hypothetical protein BRADI_2g60539v3 [Brachypodium distachyon]